MHLLLPNMQKSLDCKPKLGSLSYLLYTHFYTLLISLPVASNGAA
jgi:hypothetical protein